MKKHEMIAMKLKSDKPMGDNEIEKLVGSMGRPTMSGSFDDAKESIKSMLSSADKSPKNEEEDKTDEEEINDKGDKKVDEDVDSRVDEAVKNNDVYLVIGDNIINDPKQILDLIMKHEDAFDGGKDDAEEEDSEEKDKEMKGNDNNY